MKHIRTKQAAAIAAVATLAIGAAFAAVNDTTCINQGAAVVSVASML